MTKSFVLTRLCTHSFKPEGKMFFTGTSFTVYSQVRRVGNIEREVTRIHDGHHNNGGWWVEGTVSEVMETIMRGQDNG